MIRGWCPTVHAPMPSGDGLLVRVKPFGGRLSPAALWALAKAVAAFGNGVVELTGRGNLQVRGVRDAPGFARAMVMAGLADGDPVREARRNVIAVPPCDDALVAEAEAVLAATPGLPPKFCLVVVGGTVFLDGDVLESLHQPLTGKGSFNIPLPLAGVGRVSVADPTRQHMGSDCLQMGGATLTPTLSRQREKEDHHLLHPPFGQTDVTALAQLGVELRTTPWRAFLSPVPAPGFSPTPSTITACPGAPACASASVPARRDAARLAAAGFAHLHVSGCAKGCAHPRAATTLVGRDGRYDLVRHGRAADPPQMRSLTLTQAMAAL